MALQAGPPNSAPLEELRTVPSKCNHSAAEAYLYLSEVRCSYHPNSLPTAEALRVFLRCVLCVW